MAGDQTERSASAHFIVWEDGRVDNIVDLSLASWHAGNGIWRNKTGINAWSVGIEIVNLGTNHPDYNDCYPVEDKEPASDCKQYKFTE